MALPLPAPAGEELGLYEEAQAWNAPPEPAPRQIVPGLLIKFVPPGTLTKPGGYAQAPAAAPVQAPQADVHPAIAAAWGMFTPAGAPAFQPAAPAPMPSAQGAPGFALA